MLNNALGLQYQNASPCPRSIKHGHILTLEFLTEIEKFAAILPDNF